MTETKRNVYQAALKQTEKKFSELTKRVIRHRHEQRMLENGFKKIIMGNTICYIKPGAYVFRCKENVEKFSQDRFDSDVYANELGEPYECPKSYKK